MGGVWQQIYPWDMVIHQKTKDQQFSSCFLKRLLWKAGVKVDPKLTLQESKLKQQTIFQHYLQEKPKAEATQKTFQDGLTEALAEKHNSLRPKRNN